MSAALTVTKAARRVRRSRRTIERWIVEGLPVAMVKTGKARTRYIDEEMLLAWYRQNLPNTRAKKHLTVKNTIRDTDGA